MKPIYSVVIIATRQKIFSVPEKTEGLSLVSNFWYQLDESFCSGTRSCDWAREIKVMVRNRGALHWVEFIIIKSHFLSTPQMQDPAALLNVKEETKRGRAALGSSGSRRRMIAFSKLSMLWHWRLWKRAQCPYSWIDLFPNLTLSSFLKAEKSALKTEGVRYFANGCLPLHQHVRISLPFKEQKENFWVLTYLPEQQGPPRGTSDSVPHQGFQSAALWSDLPESEFCSHLKRSEIHTHITMEYMLSWGHTLNLAVEQEKVQITKILRPLMQETCL